jgi:predicted CoA-binding protein
MKKVNTNIEEILKRYKNIAVVGLSANPVKASHRVTQYLKNAGYRIYPVNPNYHQVLGEKCYAGLKQIPDRIEIVDIFRRPEYIPEIVEDAISVKARVIWMQLGIKNEETAQNALEAGMDVVMDRCLKIEHQRFG